MGRKTLRAKTNFKDFTEGIKIAISKETRRIDQQSKRNKKNESSNLKE